MHLILVRHAKALPEAPSGLDDDRPLSDRGRRQAQRLAGWLAELPTRLERIVSSPIVRADQTAELLAALARIPIAHDERLSTRGTPGSYLDVLTDLAGTDNAAIVGHNPTLEQVLGTLLQGHAGASVRMRTGQAALLDLDPADPIGSASLIDMVRFDD